MVFEGPEVGRHGGFNISPLGTTAGQQPLICGFGIRLWQYWHGIWGIWSVEANRMPNAKLPEEIAKIYFKKRCKNIWNFLPDDISLIYRKRDNNIDIQFAIVL